MFPARHPAPPLRLRWGRIAVVLAVAALAVSCLAARYTGASPLVAPPAASPSDAPVPECPAPPAPAPVRSAPALRESPARTVALTFDDGPANETLPVLDVLAREQVRATFFVVGKAVATRPDVLAEITRRGHLLGNHSWSHRIPGAAGWDEATVTTEIEQTAALVHTATGTRPCFFRPPQGVTLGLSPVTERLGLSVALWSVDTRDWALRPGEPGGAERIREAAAKGLEEEHPVVLLHDGGGDRGATLAALPGVIADYRSRGYVFVRLDGQR